MDLQVDMQYAYAVGRIRANERKLLDRSKLDRMLDARTPEDALKVLSESGFGYSEGEAANVNDYEKLLSEELEKLYSLIREIVPDPAVFDLFLLRNDYHNLKVILKSEFLGTDNDAMLVDTGTITAQKLKLAVHERRLAELPESMAKAVEECLDVYNRMGDPQMLDIILDRACFKQMSCMADNADSKFLSGLLKVNIDLINIRTFIRIKKMQKSSDFAEKAILPDGNLDVNFFTSKIEGSLGDFIQTLQHTKYSGLAGEGEVSLTKLEKAADDYIMSYTAGAKYKALGLEPVIGFIIARETDIKNARIVMVGKINGLSNNIIRERLRLTYV